MRILHTSDWHLTEKLGSVDRHPDIVARLREIARYLDEYRVDVMLVSGDMFSQCTRWDEIERAVKDVNTIFKPYLLRGGTIVAISGNHDNEHLFSILRTTLDLALPLDTQQMGGGPRPSGRLYLASEPGLLRLSDEDGQVVQFVLLPYPTQMRYLKDEKIRYSSLADKHQRLHDELVKRLDNIVSNALREDQRSVLVSHIHVRGSEIHTSHHLSENEEIVFEQGELPTRWEYMALGHIHKPQAIRTIPHARYAGSIERLDWGEREDDKGVVFVEIGPDGRTKEPILLPLEGTLFYEIEIRDHEKDIQQLQEQYPNATPALVRCHIIYKPGDDLNSVLQAMRAIFPRCYKVQLEMEGLAPAAGAQGEQVLSPTVETTIENYLQERLKEHPLRDEVLSAARELIVNVE